MDSFVYQVIGGVKQSTLGHVNSGLDRIGAKTGLSILPMQYGRSKWENCIYSTDMNSVYWSHVECVDANVNFLSCDRINLTSTDVFSYNEHCTYTYFETK